MTRLSILGATGYAGAHVARLAAARGLHVTGFSRGASAEPIAGVDYVTGSLLESEIQARALDADVVVAALSPRGDMAGRVTQLYLDLARAAAGAARFIVIGGFGSLRPADGAPRIVDTDAFPADYRPEALELAAVLDGLPAIEGLDWLYVSPAADFGGFTPENDRGAYRMSGEIAILDGNGASQISGADFATAIVDEIEAPAHSREHIGLVA